MSSNIKSKNSQGLTTTSFVLLAQLSMRSWSTYELARQRVRYFRFVWPRAESAIYREVKQLAARGLISPHISYTGKRKQTTYSITPEGLSVLKEWLTTPVSPFSMEFEAIIRVLIAPLASTEDLLTTLSQVQNDAQEMLRFAGEVKAEFLEGRNPLQDQAYLRALAVDFFISLLYTVYDWTERSIIEVRDWNDKSLDERNRRGIEIISGLPVQVPAWPADGVAIPPSNQNRR
jgi:DNA-binding PadR family transcriptional regulator